MSKKIVITGGTGRFGEVLKKVKTKHNILYPNKKELNITNFNKIKSYLKKKKPNIVVHLAGLSRPMNIHEKNISKSIILNIIGILYWGFAFLCWLLGIYRSMIRFY